MSLKVTCHYVNSTGIIYVGTRNAFKTSDTVDALKHFSDRQTGDALTALKTIA